MLVGIITAASMTGAPQQEMSAQQRQLMVFMPALLTVMALWKMAAGIGLYWGMSSAVGLVQSIIARRTMVSRSA